ncbi:hypothetical protein [Streptomyces melanosporofaciens]|uniref:GDSL-like Lipase/Acylhydrolase family protein n=1 Tax=Streptomyces melanosporofaciens TaxID=67327 RepID=A0A1H4Z8I2_STRMJ|nr:hypothetical protein [Streptomyces melanosporofaciens]SED26469.1 hypothetical protein SAMN04490356_7701 [Streptomyces melanosporofaciens]
MTLPGYGKSIGALADQAESLDNIDPDNGEATGGEAGRLDERAPKWLHEQIRPRITATLKTIHDKAPNAKIVLMGCPRLLEDNGSRVLGMEGVEGKWVNSVADILADEMKGAVDGNCGVLRAVRRTHGLWKAWNAACPERCSPSRERQSRLWRYSYATLSSAPAMPPRGPRKAQIPTAAHG